MKMDCNNDTARRTGSVTRKLLVIFVVAMLAFCGGYYYLWKQARVQAWRQGEDAAVYRSLRDTFLDHIQAGRLLEAYVLTSQRFQNEVDRFQFAQLAQKYNRLDQQRPEEILGEGAGQSGPPSGDPGDLAFQYMQFHRQFRLKEGKLVNVILEIRREPDSMLFLAPPGFKVDVFSIEEKPQQPVR